MPSFNKEKQVPQAKAQRKNAYWFSGFFALFVLPFSFYLLQRAIHVPLVFDEATSYFLYIKNGEFLPGSGFWSANNHYLNSLLTWLILVNEDSLSPLELRYANLAAFVLFAAWLFQIAKTLNSKALRFLLLPAIFSVPYLIEFFAYARGYGLALAFLVGCLLYLHQWQATFKISKLYKLAGCVFLMVAASLSTLPAAGMIVLAAVFVQLKSRKNGLASVPAFLMMTASLLGGAYVTNVLSSKGELYYGGNEGLWKTTIASLQEVFFNAEGGFLDVVFGLIAILIAASAVFAAWYSWQKKSFNFRFFPLLIVLVALLFYVFANIFLGVLYPIDRAVLYLVLLVLIALFFTADVWAEYAGKPWPMLLLLPFIVFPATFVQKINVSSASANAWSVEQMPDSFYRKLVRTNHSIGGYFLRQPQWNFHNLSVPKPVFAFTKSSPENTSLDYVVAGIDHLENYTSLYDAIDTNASQNLFLLQRKRFLKRVVLDSVLLQPVATLTSDFKLNTIERSRLAHVNALDIALEMESSKPQFAGVIAVSGVDASNQTVFWYDQPIGNLTNRSDFKQTYRLFVPLGELPEALESVTIFLWNLKGEKYVVYNAVVNNISLIEP